jgi:hypothetical protein
VGKYDTGVNSRAFAMMGDLSGDSLDIRTSVLYDKYIVPVLLTCRSRRRRWCSIFCLAAVDSISGDECAEADATDDKNNADPTLDFKFDCSPIVDRDFNADDDDDDDDDDDNSKSESDGEGSGRHGLLFSLLSSDDDEGELEEEVRCFLLFFALLVSSLFRLSSYAIFLILSAAIVAARRFVRRIAGAALEEFVMATATKKKKKGKRESKVDTDTTRHDTTRHDNRKLHNSNSEEIVHVSDVFNFLERMKSQ